MVKEEKNYNYCIPSPMAKIMSLVDDRTQMEASILSVSLLMLGMLLSILYVTIYSDWSWWLKGMTIFNGLCGILFMLSSLITTFQQYQRLRETQDLVGNFRTEEPFPDIIKEEQLFTKEPILQNKVKIYKKEVKI